MSDKTKLKYPLEKVKQVVNKWLYLDDDEIVDVMLATHLANKFDADPIWMLFIAPPSSTKTELLRGFKDHPDTYSLSTLTPATLISGKQMKDGKNPSLIFHLNDKTLIIKDFTTILSMRSEGQQEILAQLREVYDGYYSKPFGTGKHIKWEGRVGLMAACTAVYDKHYGVIGSMGDRFMLYRSNQGNNREMGLKAQKNVGREDEMRAEIQTAIHAFINQFQGKTAVTFERNSDEINESIVALACFCAIARTPVERDYRTRNVTYQPEAEGSGRLTKQLTQIGMALACIRGKASIDEPAYSIVKKIGRDLISKQRLKMIECLWDDRILEITGGWRATKDIAKKVKIPASTTKVTLEDLMVIGVLNQEREDETEKAPYVWQLSQEACELIGACELFD